MRGQWAQWRRVERTKRAQRPQSEPSEVWVQPRVHLGGRAWCGEGREAAAGCHLLVALLKGADEAAALRVQVHRDMRMHSAIQSGLPAFPFVIILPKQSR